MTRPRDYHPDDHLDHRWLDLPDEDDNRGHVMLGRLLLGAFMGLVMIGLLWAVAEWMGAL